MPIEVINGVRMNYVQIGGENVAEGEPAPEDLIMVHGLATNMAFWYFKYGVPLAQRFRVTLYDLRGHGRSEMPASGYSPAVLSQDLAALMDHLGIAKSHFMAHSFGGVVTLGLACEQPHRVSSLVLADSHFSPGRDVQARDEWSFGQKFQPIIDAHGLDLDTCDPYFGPKLLARVAEWQLQGREIPAALADLVSPLVGKTGKRTAGDYLKLMTQTSAATEMLSDDGLTLERLRALKFPIVAMYGDNSPARLSGAELLSIWPHAEFRRVRDAGHFFPTLRPEEVLWGCQRFWGGEFTPSRRRHRAGESKRSHFRSDRLIKNGDAWYFVTRNENRVGPFAGRDEARKQLASYLSEVAS